MIRNFFKHILESLKNMKRNGWMTIAAVSSVMITLILVGTFLSVILNTAKLASDIEKNVRVMTYLKVDVYDQEEMIPDPKNKTKKIKNPNYKKVYNELKDLPDVQKITFSSNDDQYKDLIKSLGPDWKLFKDDANPLYDAYIVEASSPAKVKGVTSAISKLQGVEKATYGGDNANKIFGLANTIRNWGIGAAALLLFVAIFLISNTIRITILSRQREIQIMRLVGAKNGYIRWPFFLEGAWVGLLGAIVPSLLITWAYNLVYRSFSPSLYKQALYLYSPDTFVPQIIILMVIIGVLIGAFGSLLSMRRFLKI